MPGITGLKGGVGGWVCWACNPAAQLLGCVRYYLARGRQGEAELLV